jgi:prepilin signal peptidase PulO-like enzyme (type II secretory pathway)
LSPWLFPFGTLIWLKGAICGYFLLILFFTDFTELFLPDAIQFPLALLGLLFTLPQIIRPDATVNLSLFGGSPHAMAFYNGLQPSLAFHGLTRSITWGQSLLGLAIGYLAPALLNAVYKAIRKSDGLGMGAFKMLGWLGAFWGWATALSIFGLAICLAIPIGILMYALRRPNGPTMMPFGSFLAVATPLVLFFGPKV